MWFGTKYGVSRYDGRNFVNLTTEDGLADNWVDTIHGDTDGVMWFGTFLGGVSRYDGKDFVNLTARDGLAGNKVTVIHRDPDGVMWFGTEDGGISRYDGAEFTKLTTKDGLVHRSVYAIYRDPDGVLWFGTLGGVSQYDGSKFVSFTEEDGLAHNAVNAIHRDQDGMMWFGTYGAGVSRYDGTAWASLDTRDGLAGNDVRSIHQDSEGFLWFATEGGITRYLPNTKPPKVRIVSVTTDQPHTDLSAIPACAVGTRITIEYRALDFRTHQEKQQYRYCIKELDSDWRRPTKETEFDWTPRKSGTYTFMVQAIDRDLNYSEPAPLSIAISAPPFYRTGIFALVLSIVGGVALLGTIILGIHRLRSSRAEKLRLQQELEDAHQMQAGLLPQTAPLVEGFEIAGSSQPAREVGGDFFDYLSLGDGKIGIAIADVSGKGLKGAMNAVLTSGILNTEAEKVGGPCGAILSGLNVDLYPRTEKQMFTALGLAILDPNAKKIAWANAAQPYPLVKRGEEVFEFKSDSELPSGMMPNVTYPDWELEVQAGDIVIFYTDGLIEAENEAEEM